MRLFKIKKRKVWHVHDGRTGSMCNSASTFDIREEGYNPRIDEEYADIIEVDEIPYEVHDGLCKSCIMHAFEKGKVRIIAGI